MTTSLIFLEDTNLQNFTHQVLELHLRLVLTSIIF